MGTTAQGAMRGLDAVALEHSCGPRSQLQSRPKNGRPSRCAENRLKAQDGFDFNDDRDGLLVEGTAQAALVYRLLGNPPGRSPARGDRDPDLAIGLAFRDP